MLIVLRITSGFALQRVMKPLSWSRAALGREAEKDISPAVGDLQGQARLATVGLKKIDILRKHAHETVENVKGATIYYDNIIKLICSLKCMGFKNI